MRIIVYTNHSSYGSLFIVKHIRKLNIESPHVFTHKSFTSPSFFYKLYNTMTDFRGTFSSDKNGECEYTLSNFERSELIRLSTDYTLTDNDFRGTLSCYPRGGLKYSPSDSEVYDFIKHGDVNGVKDIISMGYDVNLFNGLSIGCGPSLCALAFAESDFELFNIFLDNTNDSNLGFVSSEIALFPGSLSYLKLIVKRIGMFKPDVLKYSTTIELLGGIKETDTLYYMSEHGADLSFLFSIFSSPSDISILVDMGADVNKKIIGLSSKFTGGTVDETISMVDLYQRGYEFMCKFSSYGLEYSVWEDAMFVVMSAL